MRCWNVEKINGHRKCACFIVTYWSLYQWKRFTPLRFKCIGAIPDGLDEKWVSGSRNAYSMTHPITVQVTTEKFAHLNLIDPIQTIQNLMDGKHAHLKIHKFHWLNFDLYISQTPKNDTSSSIASKCQMSEWWSIWNASSRADNLTSPCGFKMKKIYFARRVTD